MMGFHAGELGLDVASVVTVWRLATISAAAFSIGLAAIIAGDVFRNRTWVGISGAWVLLMLISAMEQASRLHTDGFSWRLPIFTIALVVGISAQVAIVRRKVDPYE